MLGIAWRRFTGPGATGCELFHTNTLGAALQPPKPHPVGLLSVTWKNVFVIKCGLELHFWRFRKVSIDPERADIYA